MDLEKPSMAEPDPKLRSSPEARNAFLSKVPLRAPGVREIIMVSRDRAALVFTRWQDRIKGRSGWHTPLALTVTLGVTLSTASFTDLWFAKAGTIKGTFIVLLVGSFVWLVREVWRGATMPSASADQFIEELAAGTEKADYVVPAKQWR